MAAPVLLNSEEICSVPWLVRKLTFTAGNTATAFNHGGPASIPDMILARPVEAANPTATEVAVYSESTTQITLDCEAGSGGVTVYCVWFDGAAGGIS
jgi:hypothetical protein